MLKVRWAEGAFSYSCPFYSVICENMRSAVIQTLDPV